MAIISRSPVPLEANFFVWSEKKQIPHCARDEILGAPSFRAKHSEPRNLLLVAALSCAVCFAFPLNDSTTIRPWGGYQL